MANGLSFVIDIHGEICNLLQAIYYVLTVGMSMWLSAAKMKRGVFKPFGSFEGEEGALKANHFHKQMQQYLVKVLRLNFRGLFMSQFVIISHCHSGLEDGVIKRSKANMLFPL